MLTLAGGAFRDSGPSSFGTLQCPDLGSGSCSWTSRLSAPGNCLLLDYLSLLGIHLKRTPCSLLWVSSCLVRNLWTSLPHQILERLAVPFVVLPLCHQAGCASQPLTFNIWGDRCVNPAVSSEQMTHPSCSFKELFGRSYGVWERHFLLFCPW